MDADDSMLMPNKIQKLCEEQDVSQGQDRISVLPDDILVKILSFLTTKEIIRTSLLSKRWQYLWISVPNFKFATKGNYNSTLRSSFINLVCKALFLRRDLCIQKFYLRTDMPIRESDVFVWLSVAIHRKVQNLGLLLDGEGDFLLPPDLFTSKSLSKFKLELHSTLHVPSSICFFSLKTLTLSSVEFDEVKSVEKIFSGCPVLEELVLEDCCWTNIKNVTLSIPSLRELTIYSSGDELFHCTIKICAVNLISIDFSNDMVVELVPHDLSSLVYASIAVDFNLDEERSQRAVKLLNGIQNVESLSISYFSLQSFTGSPLVQEQLPTFDNLTHITVKCETSTDGIGHSALMQLLQKVPNLESLYIDDGIDPDPEVNGELEVLPHCVKSCLETFSLSYFKWSAAEIDF